MASRSSKRFAVDMPTFELSAAHAGAHSLNDQIALKFSDRADDDDDGASQWTAGIEVLPPMRVSTVSVFIVGAGHACHR
jgi:hypothetical protein